MGVPQGGAGDPAPDVAWWYAIMPLEAVSSTNLRVLNYGRDVTLSIRHERAEEGALCRETTQYQ